MEKNNCANKRFPYIYSNHIFYLLLNCLLNYKYDSCYKKKNTMLITNYSNIYILTL